MLEISNLFWVMLVLSAIVFFGVSGVLFYSVFHFRGGRDVPEPKQVYGNRVLEIAWTLIPTLILVVAFIATVKAIHDINTPEKGKIMNIDVIGHQWWWEFRYREQGVTTANELHLPTGVPIHFHITSHDVIHSFWTPQLQRQVDANPAIDNAVFLKVDRPGIYDGDCYEYCGAAHAFMKYRVAVQTPSQFNAWVRAQKRPAYNPTSGLAALGKKVFLGNSCVNCHFVAGTSAGGVVGPILTHVGSRWSIGAGAAPMSVNDLMRWIHDPTAYKPNVLMPGYPLLTQKDLKALATYIASLK